MISRLIVRGFVAAQVSFWACPTIAGMSRGSMAFTYRAASSVMVVGMPTSFDSVLMAEIANSAAARSDRPSVH